MQRARQTQPPCVCVQHQHQRSSCKVILHPALRALPPCLSHPCLAVPVPAAQAPPRGCFKLDRKSCQWSLQELTSSCSWVGGITNPTRFPATSCTRTTRPCLHCTKWHIPAGQLTWLGQCSTYNLLQTSSTFMHTRGFLQVLVALLSAVLAMHPSGRAACRRQAKTGTTAFKTGLSSARIQVTHGSKSFSCVLCYYTIHNFKRHLSAIDCSSCTHRNSCDSTFCTSAINTTSPQVCPTPTSHIIHLVTASACECTRPHCGRCQPKPPAC